MAILCECAAMFESRVESSSSSPRVDSQIRPHNNNKSGNYCIKCLIYVFSQLFYLWACTVHCSTGFLCASTASLGPCSAPLCLVRTWLNFALGSQVTIELYLLSRSHAEHYEFPVSTRNKKLRNLFDIPTECHTHREREREFPPKVKLSNWAMRTGAAKGQRSFM